jgi:hypothetical protein
MYGMTGGPFMVGYFCALKVICFSVFQVLNETFPDHTFLMNGLIMGIKVRELLLDLEECKWCKLSLLGFSLLVAHTSHALVWLSKHIYLVHSYGHFKFYHF